MSRCNFLSQGIPGSFPRVSGDEPVCEGYDPYVVSFSPRERG